MTRRYLATLMMAAFSAVVLTAGAAIAHPGHEQKILGTVTMAAVDHVMVKSPDGKHATVTITKDTKFMQAKKVMKASDLKVGMRIVVTAVTDDNDEKLIAQIIELGKPPAAK